MSPVNQVPLQAVDLFDGFGHYLDPIRLFYACTGKLPSVKKIEGIAASNIRNWLDAEWEAKIMHRYQHQQYDPIKKKFMHLDISYLLKNGMMLHLEPDELCVYYDGTDEAASLVLAMQFYRFVQRPKIISSIRIVTHGHDGLTTQGVTAKKPKLQLHKHYNEDLRPVHNIIKKALTQKDKSGLILFHGAPGTGKSTYIRYLICSIYKRVIFMPPGLAGTLDAPAMSKLLLANTNSVFVIEDAEDLLLSRDKVQNNAISMLLNLTDGLLGETLGIQVIATFNTSLQHIDKALLRKGRLTALYEFKPLAPDRSQALVNELSTTGYLVTQPMTLADIYNLEKDAYQLNAGERPQIGFLANAV